jgi:hypothetical protein
MLSFSKTLRVNTYDNAGKLANHLKSRLGTDFLGPFHGRLCKIKDILALDLYLKSKEPAFQFLPDNQDKPFVLYDRFHSPISLFILTLIVEKSIAIGVES